METMSAGVSSVSRTDPHPPCVRSDIDGISCGVYSWPVAGNASPEFNAEKVSEKKLHYLNGMRHTENSFSRRPDQNRAVRKRRLADPKTGCGSVTLNWICVRKGGPT